jgi:NAD(P)-dependent dehydrogenase (short-subunit alcohol dehydrogenase family)
VKKSQATIPSAWDRRNADQLGPSRRGAGHGAHVALADVQEELGQQVAESLRAAGGEALFVRCDVAAEGEVDSAIDKVLEWRDRLDYAFNNAGVPPADATTAGYPENG